MSIEKAYNTQRISEAVNVTQCQAGEKNLRPTWRNFLTMEIANSVWQQLRNSLSLQMLVNEN